VAAHHAASSRSSVANRLKIIIFSSALALAALAALSATYLRTEHPRRHMTLTSRFSLMNSAVGKRLLAGAAKGRAGKRRSPLAGSWRPSQSGAAWIPQPNKYLMAYCMRGQVSTASNLLTCSALRAHVLLPPFPHALLRTLGCFSQADTASV